MQNNNCVLNCSIPKGESVFEGSLNPCGYQLFLHEHMNEPLMQVSTCKSLIFYIHRRMYQCIENRYANNNHSIVRNSNLKVIPYSNTTTHCCCERAWTESVLPTSVPKSIKSNYPIIQNIFRLSKCIIVISLYVYTEQLLFYRSHSNFIIISKPKQLSTEDCTWLQDVWS